MTSSIPSHRFFYVFIALLLAAPAGRAGAAGFLHVQGQDIVDENGQKIMLRGLGLGNWMLPEGYMWRFGNQADRPRRIEKLVSDLIGPEESVKFWPAFRRNYITEADIRRIAELGFNSVRPALNARLFLTEGDNPVYVDEGFELLDNLVKWCRAHKVYVIIDMHGAPGGQTGTNIDDSAHDEAELFSHPQNQERLLKLWVKIADRYKDEPYVAGYDLLNEPLPGRTGAKAKYKDQLEPLYKRLTAAIRTVDKRHLITVEGADWANDWSVFTEPFDPQLVYQFHYYAWDRPDNLKGIGTYLAARARLNRPVWVGETGEKDNAIYWGTTDMFEQNNIGWAFWPWKKMLASNGPYSIQAPEGWDAVQAYSRGGDKPSPELARRVFAQLLQNVLLENCDYHEDVVNAILRRAPVRLEAENYGHEGRGKSYSVKATGNARLYRTSEPVPIEPVANRQVGGRSGRRLSSGQAIQLSAGEWTAYSVDSPAARPYDLTIKAMATGTSAAFELAVNGESQVVRVDGQGWTELKLKPAALKAGANRLKLTVTAGTVQFDFIDLR